MSVILNQGVITTFFKACNLAFSSPLKRYVWLPLLINIALLSFGSYSLLTFIAGFELFSAQYDFMLWNWLINIANWSLKLLLYFLFFPILMHAFAILATFIVSPFNGQLAEQTSHYLRQSTLVASMSFKQEVVAGFQREWLKICYFFPRIILLFLLGFVPIVNFLIPFVWLFFAAWMAAIQFLDYPADNQQIEFSAMLKRLQLKRWQTIKFGFLVALLMLVPILNFVLIPITVIAATYYWASHYQKC